MLQKHICTGDTQVENWRIRAQQFGWENDIGFINIFVHTSALLRRERSFSNSFYFHRKFQSMELQINRFVNRFNRFVTLRNQSESILFLSKSSKMNADLLV